MISEYIMEGISKEWRSLIYGTIPAFAWRKTTKNLSQTISGPRFELETVALGRIF
jgi:hypothetical protein